MPHQYVPDRNHYSECVRHNSSCTIVILPNFTDRVATYVCSFLQFPPYLWIPTSEPELMNGLVVHDKAQRVANFHAETLKTACELAGAAGLRSLSDIMPEHVMRRTSRQVVESFADLYPRMVSGSLFKASEKDGGKSFAQILDENCDSFVTLEEFNSFARQHRDEASGHLTRDYR